jgi:nicotinate-nucleotide adenylyltransferase
MNIGLYFGAFNPVHNGHMKVANYVLNNSDLDIVWLVLTPKSPHKIDRSLIDFKHRYKMLKIVCKKNKNILPSDIEKNLPEPNYTINTLDYLKKETTSDNYSLIIGDDNIMRFTSWKQHKNIIKNHKIYVYPRNNFIKKYILTHENIYYLNAPIINVSATNIRKKILDKKTDDLKIDPKVLSYLINNKIKINI